MADVLTSPDEVLRDLRSATDHLLTDIDGLPDRAAREPSLLPGWTRGHVLTHIARNAEGGTRLLNATTRPSWVWWASTAAGGSPSARQGRPTLP
jgi:maleylpyruvate isomerase